MTFKRFAWLWRDEPLSGLDTSLRVEVRIEIRRRHDAFQIMTVYVTHDPAEAMVTSALMIVMNHARIWITADPLALHKVSETICSCLDPARTNRVLGPEGG